MPDNNDDPDYIFAKFFDHRFQQEWKLSNPNMRDLFDIDQDRLDSLREQNFKVFQGTGRSRMFADPSEILKMFRDNCPDDTEETHQRMVQIFYIRYYLFNLFGDHSQEHRWLCRPQDDLCGKCPMELILSRDLQEIYQARDFVDHVCNGYGGS